MLKGKGNILIGIADLFMGQLDVQANAVTAPVESAAVGGFHDPRPATADDRKTGIGKGFSYLLCLGVPWMVFPDAC